ncbi:hypothetical protein P4O66_013645, partial [Electrophorus voltai]
QALLRLKQGVRSAAEYAMEFWTLATGTRWNEPTQIGAFVNGLRAELQVELACKQEASTLNEVVHLAITFNRLLQEKRRCVHQNSPQQDITGPARQTDSPEELDAAGVQPKRGDQRRGNNAMSCSQSRSMFKVPVEVSYKCWLLSASALVDSRVAGNVMDWGFAKRLGIKAIALPSSLSMQALDRGPVGPGYITLVTPCVLLITQGGYSECIAFFLLSSLSHSITLGLPWMRTHSPQEYENLAQVISLMKATQVPPHQGWDCTITLKEGMVHPRCRTYPLSQEKEWAMDQYIKEALEQGYSHPSTSPAPARVFFVKKKDGGLRPCVDYQGFNKLLLQYPYPLPLVPAALEQLRGAKFFTKLDLHSAYNLIQVKEGDKWKMAFSTSTGHYEYLVLPYGLAMAPSIFQAYINEVEKAFEELKTTFSTLPVLQQPDPERPFVVEVDASDIGVGTVLSQHTRERGGLWHIAYFSQKQSPAERNYGIGDRELLSMKLAFVEWRHWLEGAQHPFTMYMDHKNLEYLQTTKRLNARQARWSIFFSRFQFQVTHRPGEQCGDPVDELGACSRSILLFGISGLGGGPTNKGSQPTSTVPTLLAAFQDPGGCDPHGGPPPPLKGPQSGQTPHLT